MGMAMHAGSTGMMGGGRVGGSWVMVGPSGSGNWVLVLEKKEMKKKNECRKPGGSTEAVVRVEKVVHVGEREVRIIVMFPARLVAVVFELVGCCFNTLFYFLDLGVLR